MAEYGKYTEYNEEEMKSKATDLKNKISTAKGELSSFESTLSDDIWKASSKDTLKKAFQTLNDDVNTEINAALDKITTVANYIGDYKKAESRAKEIKQSITTAKSTNPDADTSALESELSVEEGKMETAVSNVNTNL